MTGNSNTDPLHQWMQARDMAKQWAEHERKLRDYLCATYFKYDPVGGNIDGTRHHDLGNGWDMKAVFGKTYSVKDDDKFRAAMVAYRDLPIPPAKPVVLFKPAISTTGWNAAGEQVRNLLAPVVTMRPNAPQLTIEAKK